jgi:hypothetical protein
MYLLNRLSNSPAGERQAHILKSAFIAFKYTTKALFFFRIMGQRDEDGCEAVYL